MERIVVLEAEVKVLRECLQRSEQNFKEISEKLDSLLTLRHKGVGAFWLASLLTGTGIIGFFVSMIDWFRGT